MTVAGAGEEMRPGIVTVLQTFGLEVNFRPHLHSVVSCGGWTPSGKWVPVRYCDPHAAESFFAIGFWRPSATPGLPKNTWPLVGSNVGDMDLGTPNYQYTDFIGATGTWYYQVTAYNGNCGVEGPF